MAPRVPADLPSRFLFAVPAMLLAVGGLRPLGVTPFVLYAALALVLVATAVAAWSQAGPALRSGEFARRAVGAAGLLFAFVLGAIGLFAALGPPQSSTHAENQLRYPLILLAALACAAACVLLARSLAATGERFHSTLGFAAALLAAPLYVVFAAMQLVEYRTLAANGADAMPPEVALLDAVSIVLLLFGVALNYLATASFARALVDAGWLGRRAGGAFAGIALFAAACVAARTAEALAAPDAPLWGFQHVWAAPGFVLAIPAVPWLMPCLLGTVAVRRAGNPSAG